ncbi:polysaccharide deacetylase family protein [Paenibacillus ferrarius]|uniref:polysaccharide deacetylase family protein n=1 Tax=Paenibacillus ferrarius TaxID=1469647 RepID=UPI003D2B9122
MKEIPDKLVVLTFDDALNNHATYVAPILKKYGFNATFFVCEFPSLCLDGGVPCPGFENKEFYMSWEQIAELNKTGFEIGNHTMHHRFVTIPREELLKEIEDLNLRCMENDIPVPISFCYPANVTSEESLSRLNEKGFQWARRGGESVYDPAVHHPLLIPSFEAPLKKDMNEFAKMVNQAEKGKITVLYFHGIPDLAHPWVSMEPEAFEAYMEYLFENNFKVIAMRELSNYMDPLELQVKIQSQKS